MDFLCFIIVGTGVLDGPFGRKCYFMTARTTKISLALRSKFAKANIVVAFTTYGVICFVGTGVLDCPFRYKCYFMTKDYSSTASGLLNVCLRQT